MEIEITKYNGRYYVKEGSTMPSKRYSRCHICKCVELVNNSYLACSYFACVFRKDVFDDEDLDLNIDCPDFKEDMEQKLVQKGW